ncbi:MAG: hypothetical protein FJ197_06995 [Gammaproteobacteria bacterium]|nr:hypothetical protein [Gammaproteobacteria bacterium]
MRNFQQWRQGALVLTSAAVTVLALAVPLTATAQIEEIIVEARKREEALSEVPVAIEAIRAEDIQQKGLTDLAKIAQQSASIKFDQGSSRNDTRLAIRGLSPTRGRQNAAILVDGVDISSEAISTSGGSVLVNQRLIAVEQVDIVKGPQSALWGRSAFNGAIQFRTKDPYDTWGGVMDADLNEHDQYGFSADFGGPVLGEKLGVLVNGAWWDEDGYFDNSITGNNIGFEKGYGFAVKTKSDFGNGFTLEFRGSFEHYEYGQSPEAYLGANTVITQPDGVFTPNGDPLIPEGPPGLELPWFEDQDDPPDGLDLPTALFCLPDNLEERLIDSAVETQLLNQALIDRYTRLSFDPLNPAIGDGPHCQRRLPIYAGQAPDGDQLRVRLSTDPFNPGEDYPGLDGDTFRFTTQADWELERGKFTMTAGYTSDEGDEAIDFARYAFDDPDQPFLDDNVNIFQSNNNKDLEQTHFDIRYSTNSDGPIQMTIGGTYWKEDVENRSQSLTMQANGSYCFYSTNNLADIDAANFIFQPACPGYTELPVQYFIGPNSGLSTFGDGSAYDGIQQYTRDSPADRHTDHRSIYALVEIDMTEETTLILEGRYSHEELEVVGPSFWRTTAAGGPGSWSICGVPGLACYAEQLGLTGLDFLRRAPGTISGTDLGGPFWSEANFMRQYDVFKGITDAGVKNTALFQVNDPVLNNGGLLNPNCQDDSALLAYEAAVDAEIAAAAEEGRPARDPIFNLLNPFCHSSLSRTDDWFAPKITLQHRFSDDINVYAAWAHSEKPGGLATFTFGASGIRADLSAYDPEKMDTWEIGTKATLFDGTVYLEGVVFYNDYTDKQVLVQGLGPDGRAVSKIDNAPAEVLGGELAFLWQPAGEFLGGNWDLRASYLYIDGEYGNYIDSATSENNIALAGNCTPTTLKETVIINDPVTGVGQAVDLFRAACSISFEGNKLERAPRHTVVGAVKYSVPVADTLEAYIELAGQWKSKQYIEYTNENWLGSYANFDLFVGINDGDSWSIVGYVDNLLDDDSIRSASNQPGLGCCFVLGVSADIGGQLGGIGSTAEVPSARAAFLTPPRSIGLRANYRFGGSAN